MRLIKKGLVPEEGVEPTQSKAPADFESAASASSATPGLVRKVTRGSCGLKNLAKFAQQLSNSSPKLDPTLAAAMASR
jgi:hypothetical protein